MIQTLFQSTQNFLVCSSVKGPKMLLLPHVGHLCFRSSSFRGAVWSSSCSSAGEGFLWVFWKKIFKTVLFAKSNTVHVIFQLYFQNLMFILFQVSFKPNTSIHFLSEYGTFNLPETPRHWTHLSSSAAWMHNFIYFTASEAVFCARTLMVTVSCFYLFTNAELWPLTLFLWVCRPGRRVLLHAFALMFRTVCIKPRLRDSLQTAGGGLGPVSHIESAPEHKHSAFTKGKKTLGFFFSSLLLHHVSFLLIWVTAESFLLSKSLASPSACFHHL